MSNPSEMSRSPPRRPFIAGWPSTYGMDRGRSWPTPAT
jgi:hypothetical protein